MSSRITRSAARATQAAQAAAQAAARQYNSQNHSPLLALPPELRNRIYEYTLTVPSAEWPEEVWLCYTSDNWATHRQELRDGVFSLLLVCQQIRDEAKGIFSSVNHFRTSTEIVESLLGGEIAMKGVGRFAKSSVRKLTVVFRSHRREDFACKHLRDQLQDLNRLEVLHIDMGLRDSAAYPDELVSVWEAACNIRTLKTIRFSPYDYTESLHYNLDMRTKLREHIRNDSGGDAQGGRGTHVTAGGRQRRQAIVFQPRKRTAMCPDVFSSASVFETDPLLFVARQNAPRALWSHLPVRLAGAYTTVDDGRR